MSHKHFHRCLLETVKRVIFQDIFPSYRLVFCAQSKVCLLKYKNIWPITQKGTLWESQKVSNSVSLHSLITVETFCYWQIFCILSDNSTCLNYHFDIIELYRPVLASFPFVLFYLGVPARSLFTWVTYKNIIPCRKMPWNYKKYPSQNQHYDWGSN